MDSIEKLANIFKKFPTVGPRTASRFVFYLMKQPKEKIEEFAQAIVELKNQIKFCRFCFNPFQPDSTTPGELCHICQNASRERKILCVVEKETDLVSIEKAKKFKGIYFVLGGLLASYKKEDMDKIRIEELKERIKESYRFGMPKVDFEEVIIAINPTPEGNATSMYVERELKQITSPTPFKITHLAKGIPVGGELEYADDETLESAFEGRK